MSLSKWLITLTILLALTECGGGGGDSDDQVRTQQTPETTQPAPEAPVQPEDDASEFEEPAPETQPEIQQATVSDYQAIEEVLPPGVPVISQTLNRGSAPRHN